MTWIVWNRTKNEQAGITTLPDKEAAEAFLQRYLSNLPWDERTDDFTVLEIPSK